MAIKQAHFSLLLAISTAHCAHPESQPAIESPPVIDLQLEEFPSQPPPSNENSAPSASFDFTLPQGDLGKPQEDPSQIWPKTMENRITSKSLKIVIQNTPFYKKPSSTSTILGNLKQGQQVTVVDTIDQWSQLSDGTFIQQNNLR